MAASTSTSTGPVPARRSARPVRSTSPVRGADYPEGSRLANGVFRCKFIFNFTQICLISYTKRVLTLTTKQLREDMPRVITTLEQGTPIQLTYRHKIVGTIEPAQHYEPVPRRGDAKAFADFMKNTDFGVPDYLKNDPRHVTEIIAEAKEQRMRNKGYL